MNLSTDIFDHMRRLGFEVEFALTTRAGVDGIVISAAREGLPTYAVAVEGRHQYDLESAAIWLAWKCGRGLDKTELMA